jgi:ABC-type sugar transport system permease subunit/ABC-type glycerol-3-phosphate transport system substrate-binding protein
MRRVLSALIAAFGLAAAPAARAGEVEELPDRTVIHVTLHDWIFQGLDPARSEPAIRSNAEALKEFERRFPAIFAARYREKYRADPAKYGRRNWDRVEVRVQGFSGLTLPQVETDLLSIAGGIAPDILYINFRKSDTYIQQGFLHPLDRPEDGYITSMSREEQDFVVNEKIWPVIRRPGPGGATHVWAMPYGGAMGKVLMYRKDLFEKKGVKPPDSSWTWDDLHRACRTLADPAEGVYAISLRNVREESYYWTTFLWCAGADILSYDEPSDRWSVVFDSREAARALDFYTRLCGEPWTDSAGRPQRGYAFRDDNMYLALEKWKRGDIAMMQGYMDEKVFAMLVQPEITGLVPVPKGPTGIRAAELNSRMMGLFAGITDPAVRDAAWEFMRWFDSREAVEIKTRHMVQGGLGSFVNPRYLRLYGYDELIRLAPPGWEDTFNEAISTGKPEPYGRHSTTIYRILDEPLKEAGRRLAAGTLPADENARLDELQGLLARAADKARREVLGEIPPEEMARRTTTASLVLPFLLAGFLWALIRIVRSFSAPVQQGVTRRRALVGLLLLPAVGSVFFWQYLPLLRGSLMAFQEYNILKPSRWVGLDNFANLLFDPDWWEAVWNALRYSFLIVALTFLPPVGLAILLQEIPRGKVLFRVLFYLPAVLSSLVVILLWKTFFGGDATGMLNRMLMPVPSGIFVLLAAGLLAVGVAAAVKLLAHGIRFWALLAVCGGLLLAVGCVQLVWPALTRPDLPFFARLLHGLPQPMDWLHDRSTAMLACVLPMVWAGIGPGCLLYLAALKGIPDEYYEAAEMDGASFLDKILFVVLPALRPLLVINFTGVFVGAWFHAEANILAMTGGQAGTNVAGLEIFYRAFLYLKFGPATAMAWMLGFLLILFTMVQLRMLSRVEFKASGGKD